MERNHALPHAHGPALARLLPNMPDSAHFAKAAGLFQQLCDGSRLKILWLLCHCEECGVNIAAAVGLSTAVVSHHIKLLRLHGLIIGRRKGKEVYYTLADTELAHLLHQMVDDLFSTTCPNQDGHCGL